MLREEHDWTQETLAMIAGTSLATVQRTEAGTTTPRQGTLDRLARAFGVDPGSWKGLRQRDIDARARTIQRRLRRR